MTSSFRKQTNLPRVISPYVNPQLCIIHVTVKVNLIYVENIKKEEGREPNPEVLHISHQHTLVLLYSTDRVLSEKILNKLPVIQRHQIPFHLWCYVMFPGRGDVSVGE